MLYRYNCASRHLDVNFWCRAWIPYGHYATLKIQMRKNTILMPNRYLLSYLTIHDIPLVSISLYYFIKFYSSAVRISLGHLPVATPIARLQPIPTQSCLLEHNIKSAYTTIYYTLMHQVWSICPSRLMNESLSTQPPLMVCRWPEKWYFLTINVQ